jgi:thiol:disulfide interchange protein
MAAKPGPCGLWIWMGVASLGLVAGCGSVRWERSLDAGLKRAANEQRPALVMFSSTFSRDCFEMDQNVFTDPQVEQTMAGFVPVRLDLVMNRKLAEELGVRSAPSFVVFRPDRSVAGFQEGKLDAARFGIFLIKYRYY